MRTERRDEQLDALMHAAVGRDRPSFNFERWKQQHRDRIEVFRSQVQPSDSRAVVRGERTAKMGRALRLAAAAVILLAVLALMSDWMRIAAPAFGLEEIRQAMKQVEYSHSVLKIEEVNPAAEAAMGKRPRGWECWTSRHPPRRIEKHADGRISCVEEDTGRVLRYDPESNVIVVEQGSPASPEDLQMSMVERFAKELADAGKRGAKVEYGKGVYEGRPAMTITLDYHRPGQMRNVFSMLVDPNTHLLWKLTWEQTHPEKGWKAVASEVAEYPDSGPTDIYAAGAPRNARVLVADATAREPDAPSLEVLGRHDTARGHLPQQWTLVAVESDENDVVHRVTIIYADGPKARVEYHDLPYWRIKTSANVVPVAEGIEAVREWAHAQESHSFSAALYDGKYRYDAQYYDGAWHRQERTELRGTYTGAELSGGLDLLGWFVGRGRLIANAYATQQGLRCIEIRNPPNIQQGKVIEPACRILYYLDPQRDSMCVRREIYQYRTPPGQLQPKVAEVEFDPYRTPSEPTSVREVVEYGRFETGQPYAARFREVSANWNDQNAKWDPDGQKRWTRIYIQTEPELPKGVFDSRHPGWVP